MQDIQQDQQSIICQDGYTISVNLFPATQAKAVVVIAPALGVPASYYARFADYLRTQGYHCISLSYRGVDQSRSNEKGIQLKLEDWGAQDIDAVIRQARGLFGETDNFPIDFIGHSIGGQLVGLATASTQLRKIIFVASSAPYWRRWSFPGNLKILLAARIIIPLVCMLEKEFPSPALGLGSLKIPSKMMAQWAHWMTKPDYLFDASLNLDVSSYQQLEQPLMSFGFADDDLAPRQNIEKLLSFFPKAKTESHYLTPQQLGVEYVAHAGFFKPKFQASLWQQVLDWLSA